MSTLSIFRGLPGSGKTTEANRQIRLAMAEGRKVINVNRDSLRAMAGLGKKPSDYEPAITFQQHTLIERGLLKGYDVISSDTNLSARYVKELAEIAANFGAGVEVIDFDVPLEELIQRNANRDPDEIVPDEVIYDMHKRYCSKGFPKNPLEGMNIQTVEMEFYLPDPWNPSAFIFDIDGTIADSEGIRSPYDYDKVDLDNVHWDVVQMYHILNEMKFKIIILSGRPESCKEGTEKWLHDTGIRNYEHLYMRGADDLKRKDFIVKYELFDKHIRHNYNVIGVFDDRKQVIDNCWRKIGVRCYDVAGHTF